MERQKEELKKQHPVPQNIMEVEFKLVGDMTLRQFGYVAGGAILGYLIYVQPITGLIRWPLLITDAALALGMAFLPMEERGLDQWLANFFTAVYSPTQRVWKPSTRQRPRPKAPPPKEAPAKPKKKKKKPKKSKPENIKKLSRELKETVEKTKKKTPKTEEEAEQTVASITKELDKMLEAIGSPEAKELPEKKLREEKRLLKKRLVTLSKQYKRLKELEGAEETPANLKQTVRYYKDQLETVEEKNRALQQELEKREAENGESARERRKAQKELQKQHEDLKSEKSSLEEKIKELQKNIKSFEEKTSDLTKKNKKYREELEKKERALKALEDERTRAVSKMMKLKSKLEAGEAPTEKEKEEKSAKAAPQKEEPTEAERKPKKPPEKKEPKPEEKLRKERETAPIVKNIPNVITGVVRNKEGDLVEGQMVIIQDSDGDPVRALKTNKLGQFAVSTPLPNGTYTVKVSNGHYKPAKVTTDGSVLDPVVFRER